MAKFLIQTCLHNRSVCRQRFFRLLFDIFTFDAELLDAEVEGVSVGGSGDEMPPFLTGPLFKSTLRLS